MITRVIGIDFGTSTTVVRILNYDEEKIGELKKLEFDDHPYIPTVIFKDEDTGKLFFGYDAITKRTTLKGTFIENFKIDLISSDEKVRKDAENYVKVFIHFLYEKYSYYNGAEKFGKCDKTKTYISYPAKWPSSVRDVMKRCVIEAGFGTEESVKGKDEPTAAVLACLNENESKLKQKGLFFANKEYETLMIDMGAGTTDLVLFNYKLVNGKIELSNLLTYPSVDNDSLCGGREIDKILYDYLVAYTKRIPCNGIVPLGTLKQFSETVKNWKEETVSDELKLKGFVGEPPAICNLKDILVDLGIKINDVPPFKLDKDTFVKLTADHWNRWHDLIDGIFNDQNAVKFKYNPNNIDFVIVTGGHSQWYGVKDFLLGKKFANLNPIIFGKIIKDPNRLLLSVSPQETVAEGLCYVDKNIVAAVPLANNVWIQFEYDTKKSKIIKLAEKGTALPFTKEDIKIKDSIKGNFVFTKALCCTYTIYCGETLDSAKKFTKSIFWPVDTNILKIVFGGGFAIAIGGLKLFYQIGRYFYNGKSIDDDLIEKVVEWDYDFEINPKIDINEEGIAVISGNMKFNDNPKSIPETKI